MQQATLCRPLTPKQLEDMSREAIELAGRCKMPLAPRGTRAAAPFNGIHGQRRAGSGLDFWQLREFRSGEPASRIDWVTSAKSDTLFVRERESSRAQSIGLWVDLSGSMHLTSSKNGPTKLHRALVLFLASLEVIVEAEESFYIPELIGNARGHIACRKVAMAFASFNKKAMALPSVQHLRRRSHLVLLGDFLLPPDEMQAFFRDLAQRQIRPLCIQVLDETEVSFPYRGHVLFEGLEGDGTFELHQAEALREAYLERLEAHTAELQAQTDRLHGTLIRHVTNDDPQTALMAMILALFQAEGARPC